MMTFSNLLKEIKDPLINLLPGLLSLAGFDAGFIFLSSGLTTVISHILEFLYQKLFCVNLESEYTASVEIHKYNERKSLNQTYRVVNWYIIRGINNSHIKVQRLVCNESTIVDDDYSVRDEALFHSEYTIVPDEDYYIDIEWEGKTFQANHYVMGHKKDNPVYKIFGHSIEDLKAFEEFCLAEHRAYSKSIGKDIYKYFEWDLSEDEWTKHDIETSKNFENIFIPSSMKEDLKSKLDTFIHSRDMYKKWGIPYKMGLVFHGNPGCGKTSTIYAIADYLGRSIYFLKLDLFQSNHDLLWAAHQIPRDAIVVIEDIDAHKVAHNRLQYNDPQYQKLKPIIIRKSVGCEADDVPDVDHQDALTESIDSDKANRQDSSNKENDLYATDDDKEDEQSEQSIGDDTNKSDKDTSSADSYKFSFSNPKPRNVGKGKTIDSLLEIFDGYNFLPGAVIIITTNHLRMIDPAVIRPGRMDHHYRFDYATPETINDILDFFFPKRSDNNLGPAENQDKTNANLHFALRNQPFYLAPCADKNLPFDKHEYMNPVTTAEIINSIILPNIHNRDKAIEILSQRLFANV
jgi:hypothetical protein